MKLSELAGSLNRSRSELVKALDDAQKPVPKANEEVDPPTEKFLRVKFQPHVSNDIQQETPEVAGLDSNQGYDSEGYQQSDIPRQFTVNEKLQIKSVLRSSRSKPQRSNPHQLGVVGFPGAGKSAYLYVLGRHIEEPKIGSWVVGKVEPEYNRFIVQMHDLLEAGWAKTHPDELPVLMPMFSLERKNGLLRDYVELGSFDSSGELWRRTFMPGVAEKAKVTDYTPIEFLKNAVSNCKGLLLILDASLVRDTDHETEALLQSHCLCWRMIFDHLAALDHSHNRIRRPVAVVLNKGDTQADDLKLQELIDLRRSGDLELYNEKKAATAADRHVAAKNFVKKWFGSFFEQTKRLDHVEFFAVSCWGQQPQQDGNRLIIGPEIYPVAVDEPLHWLVDKVHSLSTTRVKRKIVVGTSISIIAAVLITVTLSLISISRAINYARTGRIDTATSMLSIAQKNPLYRALCWLQLGAFEGRTRSAQQAIALAYLNQAQKTEEDKRYVEAVGDYEAAALWAGVDNGNDSEVRRKALEGVVRVWSTVAADSRVRGDLDQETTVLETAMKTAVLFDSTLTGKLLRALSDVKMRRAIHLCGTTELALLQKHLRESESSLASWPGGPAIITDFRKSVVDAIQSIAGTLNQSGSHDRIVMLMRSLPDEWRRDSDLLSRIAPAEIEALCRGGLQKSVNGDSVIAKQDVQEAFALAVQVGRLDKALDVSFSVGISYLREKKLQQVVQVLMLSGSFVPDKFSDLLFTQAARIHYVCGKILLRTGRPTEAEAQFLLARRFVSDNSDVQRLLDHCKLVRTMRFVQYEPNGGCVDGFYMDTYEVSNEEFNTYRKTAGVAGQRVPSGYEEYEKYSPYDKGAAVFVNWNEAQAYAQFSKKRLPTEPEWELAVGASRYPWGNSFREKTANTREFLNGEVASRVHSKFAQDMSAYGIMHLAGNVSEWTQTPATDADDNQGKVVKGGSYLEDSTWCSKDFRKVFDPSVRKPCIGFRCVVDAIPADLFNKRLEIAAKENR